MRKYMFLLIGERKGKQEAAKTSWKYILSDDHLNKAASLQ